MKKFFTFACCATFALAAYAAPEPVVSPVVTETGEMGLIAEGVSADHVFVAGSNENTSRPVIWNTEDNTLVEFVYEGVYFPPLYDEETSEFIGYDYENPQPDSYEGTFHTVNKAGTAVGDFGSSFTDKTPCYANAADTEVTYLYMEEGDAGGSAYAIAEDGSVIAGFHFDESWTTHACIWRNGGQTAADRYDLPKPTDEEFGSPIDYVSARWMSADAQVILGYAQDANSGDWVMLYWTANPDGTYTAHTEYTKQFFTTWEMDFSTWTQAWVDPTKPYARFQPEAISANGEWVSLTLMETYDLDSWDMPAILAGRLNLTTGVLEVMETEMTTAPTFYGIANDGTAVGTTPVMVSPMAPEHKAPAEMGDLRQAYVWYAGGSVHKNVQEIYAEDEYFNTEEFMTEYTLAAITPDAKYIVGTRTATDGLDMWESTSYVVELPSLDTAVDNVEAKETKTMKRIENAQVIIVRDGVRYDVTGTRF